MGEGEWIGEVECCMSELNDVKWAGGFEARVTTVADDAVPVPAPVVVADGRNRAEYLWLAEEGKEGITSRWEKDDYSACTFASN